MAAPCLVRTVPGLVTVGAPATVTPLGLRINAAVSAAANNGFSCQPDGMYVEGRVSIRISQAGQFYIPPATTILMPLGTVQWGDASLYVSPGVVRAPLSGIYTAVIGSTGQPDTQTIGNSIRHAGRTVTWTTSAYSGILLKPGFTVAHHFLASAGDLISAMTQTSDAAGSYAANGHLTVTFLSSIA